MIRGRGISGRMMAAALQTLVVLSLVAFASYEAFIYPRAWVRVSAFGNRELSAGRTLSFRMRLEEEQVRLAGGSKAIEPSSRQPDSRQRHGVARHFRFAVEEGELVATESAGGMLLIYGRVYRRGTAQAVAGWHSGRPIHCYLGAIPPDARALLRSDGDYWMEVAVRPRVAPIPVRLAIKDGDGLRILGELH